MTRLDAEYYEKLGFICNMKTLFNLIGPKIEKYTIQRFKVCLQQKLWPKHTYNE